MATTIVTKNGSGAPAAGDLVQGELAVDLTNQTLYSKDSSGNVFKVGDTGGGSPGTFTDLVATDSFTSPGIDDNATSTAITIDANENVGIGTDTPTTKGRLSVSSGSGDTNIPSLYLNQRSSATDTNKGIAFGVDGSVYGRIISGMSGTGGAMAFYTGSANAPTESMRIDASGALTVGGPSTAGNMYLNSTTGFSSRIYQDGSDMVFGVGAGQAERMRIDASGWVGIGTTPTRQFHVAAPVNNGILVSSTDGTTFKGIAYNTGNNQFTIGTQTGHPLSLYTNNAERMRIDAAGTTTVTGGFEAAQPGAGTYAFAAGLNAGLTNQGGNAVAIGRSAGNTSQGSNSIAVGYNAGFSNQDDSAVAVGVNAGQGGQGLRAIAIGSTSGYSGQSDYAIAVGYKAGETTQGGNAVAIGYLSGSDTQGNNGVSVGNRAGNFTQGVGSVAMGYAAARNFQGEYSVALGYEAGFGVSGDPTKGQGSNAIAVGNQAGKATQGQSGVAIGYAAGQTTQGNFAIAVGEGSGATTQGTLAVALGYYSGVTNQGANSIAIGNRAGQTGQGANGIIINSSGSASNMPTPNHIMIATAGSKYLSYNGTDTWTFAGGDVVVPNDGIVVGTSSAMAQGGGGPLSVYSAGGSQIILGKSTGAPSISFGSTLTQYGMMEGQSGGGFKWYTGNGSMVTRMTLDNSGNLTITGTYSPSDERLKDNIVDAPAGNLNDLRVRSFDWKAGGEHQEYGFIAQELETVAPYAVKRGEADDDMWGVDYSKLVPMMIKEIQDLKAEVAALKGA